MLEHLRVIGIRSQERIQIARVVGIELPLDDFLRISRIRHIIYRRFGTHAQTNSHWIGSSPFESVAFTGTTTSPFSCVWIACRCEPSSVASARRSPCARLT